jgi:hypothetical protein
MKIGISVKIDVTKIDKSRLYRGEKGTYLDLTSFVELDQEDKYGNNGFISQTMTKEEREANAPNTPILGNVKVFYKGVSDEVRRHNNTEGMKKVKEAVAFEDDDIPF